MTTDSLTTTFAALADPTRRAILARLALGETSVNEIAAPFEMSLPAVSRHLKVLERAGLISRSRDAQWRPCKLRAEELKSAAAWLEGYRRFWDESFDRLDEYLVMLKAERQGSGTRDQGSEVKATARSTSKRNSRSTRDDKQKGKSKAKSK
jgi:DNA-binding transcriptional ArsR family regulator